jgi:gluconolactonase
VELTRGPLETISTGHGLLEGPLWDIDRGLLVADAIVGGVWAFKDGPPALVVPHRRGIGGMALHAEGGIVVSGRNVAFKRFEGTESAKRRSRCSKTTPMKGGSASTI